MSKTAEYIGFTSNSLDREYNFVVKDNPSEPRTVAFTIPNKAFTSHRLSYQNAPDLCSLKLHREMDCSPADALKTRYRITDHDLDDYSNSHKLKTMRAFHAKHVGT